MLELVRTLVTNTNARLKKEGKKKKKRKGRKFRPNPFWCQELWRLTVAMHGSPSEVTPISLRSTRVVTGNCNNATSEMSHDQHYWQQRTATRNTLSSSSSFLFFLSSLSSSSSFFLAHFWSCKCPSARKGATTPVLALHVVLGRWQDVKVQSLCNYFAQQLQKKCLPTKRVLSSERKRSK